MKNYSDAFIAISLSFVGSLFTSISFIMMKLAHNKFDDQKPVYKQPIWMLGFMTLLIGQVVNIWSYEFGDQVLLSSTTSFTVIFNTILSRAVLKEHIGLQGYLAIALICVGSTLFFTNAKNDDENYTQEELN